MKLAESRITGQGQVSVPSEVRRRLGLTPGSTMEWDEQGADIVVRRARKHTSAEVHGALFPDGPPPRLTPAALKEAIREHMRQRARR